MTGSRRKGQGHELKAHRMVPCPERSPQYAMVQVESLLPIFFFSASPRLNKYCRAMPFPIFKKFKFVRCFFPSLR